MGARYFTIGLKILLGFIGTLTLGIGGVGLMNIMLVSVTERTKEIEERIRTLMVGGVHPKEVIEKCEQQMARNQELAIAMQERYQQQAKLK